MSKLASSSQSAVHSRHARIKPARLFRANVTTRRTQRKACASLEAVLRRIDSLVLVPIVLDNSHKCYSRILRQLLTCIEALTL